MKQITELSSWHLLEKHAKTMNLSKNHAVNKQSDSNRFHLQTTNISLDFSHQRIDDRAFELLIDFANERHLKKKITALINGDIVNPSENRPALHTALRAEATTPLIINNADVMPDIMATRERMNVISTAIRSGNWLGYSGQPITSIVNIGIGGSDFGARFCVDALDEFRAKQLSYHFVSDMDPQGFEKAVAGLNPETTLFIISSKSFTTQETLFNTKKAFAWIAKPEHHHRHFIAVTANTRNANALGIENVLPIWQWVGGRYSLCSAINLMTCIAVGYEHFSEMLAGAHDMDQHFQNSDLHENIPVVMALTGMWNINFLQIPSLLLLVYANQLEKLVAYIQQLDMESNGKSVDIHGQPVNYATGPIVWGGLGNQAQHSYYQLLCQGTHKVAADFISIQAFDKDVINTLGKAKMHVLSQGIEADNSHQRIAGGMPINHIRLAACTPYCLGALIAAYEHKIYTQSVLWNINAFDQPGVESAKRLRQMVEPLSFV